MHSPLLRGEELDDREKSTQEAVELRQTGIDALVELTTIGLGRDSRGMADIAAHSGLHIVLATGIHREAHYPPEHWVHRTATEELAELFLRDITEGCDGTDYSGPREQPTRIRAGVIKVGAGYSSISPLQRRVFRGCRRAAPRPGRPRCLSPRTRYRRLGGPGSPGSRGYCPRAHHAGARRSESRSRPPRRTGGSRCLPRVRRHGEVQVLAGLRVVGLSAARRVARRRRSPAARRRWCPAYGIPLVWWLARNGVPAPAFRSSSSRDGGRGSGAPNTDRQPSAVSRFHPAGRRLILRTVAVGYGIRDHRGHHSGDAGGLVASPHQVHLEATQVATMVRDEVFDGTIVLIVRSAAQQ